MACFIIMRFRESTGRWPFIKAKSARRGSEVEGSHSSESNTGGIFEDKTGNQEKTTQVSG
jgi:hypothetical protein